MSKKNVYIFKHKVYFGDTDAAKVVYHANYVYWMEAARIDYLSHIGCPYTDLQKAQIGIIPIDLHIQYLAPLKFGDHFEVELRLENLSPASLTIGHVFLSEKTEIAKSKIKLACIDESTWKIRRLPEKLVTCIKRFEGDLS